MQGNLGPDMTPLPPDSNKTGSLDTAVVLCVFNRPRHTREIMSRIAIARPSRLYIVADGPRAERQREDELCAQVREEIARLATWPTEIRWDVAPSNMGCRKRIESGLDRVFEEVEEAIVLED